MAYEDTVIFFVQRNRHANAYYVIYAHPFLRTRADASGDRLGVTAGS